MQWKTEFYTHLRAEFADIKSRNNGKFSLRAYAHKLQIPPSTLSQMMTGKQKWTLSPKRAAEIVQRMNLKAATKKKLLTLMGTPPEVKYREIKSQDLELFSLPIHAAILCAFELPAKERSLDKIAARFGITQAKAKEIVDRLESKGYLTRAGGSLEFNSEFLTAGDGPSNEAIKRFHSKNIKLAHRALEALPSEHRHFSSFTFAANRSQLKTINDEARKFHQRIQNLLSTEDSNDEVMTISVSLFPVRDFAGEEEL